MYRLKCSLFWKLSHVQRDRVLRDWERKFLQRHRAACEECRLAEEALEEGWCTLAKPVVEPILHDAFEQRIIEALRLPAPQSPVRYWSPVLISGAVAAVAAIVALQLIRNSTVVPVPGLGTSEAKNTPPSYGEFPEIDFNSPPSFTR